MKSFLYSFCLLFIAFSAFSQIPASGIYRIQELSAVPSKKSVYRDYTSVTYNAMHIPGFTEANIQHAIVAVDSLKKQLKILFIIDPEVPYDGQTDLGFATLKDGSQQQLHYTLGGLYTTLKDTTLTNYSADQNFNYHYWRDACYFRLYPNTFRIGACRVPLKKGDYYDQNNTLVQTITQDTIVTPKGKTVEQRYHLTINQPTEKFEQHTGFNHRFIDILRNNDTLQVPVYQHRSNTGPKIGSLKYGDYMAVKEADDDWFSVSTFTQKTEWDDSPVGRYLYDQQPQYRSYLVETNGYILKDDMYPPHWVVQNEKTVDYYFFVNTTTDTAEEGMLLPIAIKVMDTKTNKRVQQFDIACGISYSGENISGFIRLIDCNFDGYPDILTSAYTGGAGPNNISNIFIFNPKTKQFEFDEILSYLPQLQIDSKTKTILSFYRASAGTHGTEHYKYRNGELVKVYFYEESFSLSENNTLEITEEKLVKGKWIKAARKVHITN